MRSSILGFIVCSILGFIVWMSLPLPNDHFSVDVPANLTNTTLYSTHPQFVYAPESCCMTGPLGRCMKRYDPFTMTTYVGPDSTKRTFFQTSSWGQAAYVYGPPRAQLDSRPGHIQIFLNGLVMTTIDLEAKYRETDDNLWSPRLIYHWQGGGIDASHILQISLLDSGSPIQGFGIDSVVYTSLEPRRPSTYELSGSEKLEEVTIQDTNFVTTFTPAHAWEKRISPFVSSEGIRTFHGTSNKLAYTSHDTAAMPVAEFTAQCAALAIYGASPTQLEATFAEGFRHGHLQICIGTTCEYIDTHQAYLHVPEKLRNEPVLIYSSDRMSPSSQAVKMRFLDPPSPVGHLWTMTFSHAVCSQVVPKWPWTHPIPNGRYLTQFTPFDKLGYTPSFQFGAFSPWSRMDRYSLAPAEPYWFSGMFRGHDIKIFVPPPALFPTSQYSNVRCCIDGRCHYPDIEQWLMKAGDSHSDILLVHYQDLDPFRAHQISMTAVRKEDEVGHKVIAVSRVEYQRVEGIAAVDDDAFAAVPVGVFAAVVVVVGLIWSFALSRRLEKMRQRPENRSLLDEHQRPNTTYHHHRQRYPSPSDTDGFTPNGFDRAAPPPYDAYVTSDAVITTPPRRHAPITLPGPPPPRRF
ncbi:hypothetical protein FRC04_007964 [Tulasnella sp. 424]|nr:hypothetical protein FRC04_007964 [Tulasnella sp. 424]